MPSSLVPYPCRPSIKKCLPTALYDWNIGGGGALPPQEVFPMPPMYSGSIDLVRI